jgi:membrane associated rhomboid family serine protease
MRPKNFKPWFCISIMVFCIVMFVIEIWKNGWKFEEFQINPLFGPSADVLLQLGAKRTDKILSGDAYRLFAPMVLHGGLLHLAFNMFGLLQVGFPIEREFGPYKTAAIFIISGFTGVLASAVFIPELVGVGASGAIFGLFGSAWADLIQNWSLYRGQAIKNLIQLTLVTVFNVMLGLMPYLDNFAHMGGFITGFIMGLSLLVQTRYTYEGKKKQRREYQLFLQALSIIVLPMIVAVLLLVLYLQVDAYEWCSWCHYVSCVPFPPNKPDAEKWWDCNPCSQGGITYFPQNKSMLCPDGILASGANFTAQDFSTDEGIIQICREICPSGY